MYVDTKNVINIIEKFENNLDEVNQVIAIIRNHCADDVTKLNDDDKDKLINLMIKRDNLILAWDIMKKGINIFENNINRIINKEDGTNS